MTELLNGIEERRVEPAKDPSSTSRLELLLERLDKQVQANEIVQSLQMNTEQVSTLAANLDRLMSCPLPVQTFPTTDNTRWESEKTALLKISTEAFSELQQRAIRGLSSAHKPVAKALDQFFSELDGYGKKVTRRKNKALIGTLDTLIECSPKRIIANFQALSLEIGWAFVCKFNEIIDLLAAQFPRCRAGIYAARLNYADVLQISEEVLATLRCTSTVLEDLQRRYELLEGLQSELKSDLQSAEINKIFEAIKGTFSDSLQFGSDDSGFFGKLLQGGAGLTVGSISAIFSALAVPNVQFQAQLTREQRLRVFIATAALVRLSWKDWSRLNESIVRPNLKIMFQLKGDFVANRILCLCDLITVNGYGLNKLTAQVQTRLKLKAKSGAS